MTDFWSAFFNFLGVLLILAGVCALVVACLWAGVTIATRHPHD